MSLVFNWAVGVKGSSALIWKSNNSFRDELLILRSTGSGCELGSFSSSGTCDSGNVAPWSCEVSSGTCGCSGRLLSWLEGKLVLGYDACVTDGAETEDGSTSWRRLVFVGTAADWEEGAPLLSPALCDGWDAGCWPAAAWVTTTGTLTL